LRLAFGQLAPVVEHDDVLRHLHHQLHVVLDQHHGDAARRGAADELLDLVRLVRVQSRRRLIQQQQPRLGGERARDLEALERAVRQAVGARVRPARETHGVEEGAGGLAARALGARERRQAQQRAGEAAALVQPASGHDVLERAHVEEDLRRLESAPDAGGGELMRRAAGQVCGSKPDPACVRAVDPGEQVEQRRLAGAVGADDRVHRAGLDRELDVLHRVHAAEALRQVFGCQQQGSGSSRQGLSPGSEPGPGA
jgi:hypothetical protein